MPSTNRRVLAELQRWADAYQRGEISIRFVRPPLNAGERAAARIFPVRLSQEPYGRPFEQWDPRPGARSLRLPFGDDGRLYATSERLYLVRHPRRGVYEVHREWAWNEMLSVEVVPNWRGVVLRRREDLSQVTVIGNVFHTFLVRPPVVSLAAAWLKVAAAYADAGGYLDSWMESLPQQLGVAA